MVTGGGLRPDGAWASTGDRFFLPVRVLGKLYRGLFLTELEEKLHAGELILPNEVSHPSEMAQLLLRVRSQRWVVYSKPPFGGPAQVLAYLGRYTHRTAISNARLVASSDGRVTFRHKRRCSDERWREMTLGAAEFLRRFALHALPKGSCASATGVCSRTGSAAGGWRRTSRRGTRRQRPGLHDTAL